MRKRLPIIMFSVLIIFVLGFVIFSFLAPESSPINLFNVSSDSLDCLSDDEGTCLVMPGITGMDSDTSPVSFPDQFGADFHLVVMPLDRDQQAQASTWLPHLQAVANEYENVQYWSIAPLPELNAALRILIMTGLSTSISDDALRPQATMFFLDDQELFLNAIGIDTIESIQSFVMDRNGVIFHREIGEYSPERLDAIRLSLEQLLG